MHRDWTEQSERTSHHRWRNKACIAGRATTCWKAHREGDYSGTLLIIKDSWQYLEREATNKDVVNIARYYRHETVRVGGRDDDIWSNIREELDITKAANYWRESSMLPPSTSVVGASRKGRSSSNTGQKRSSSCTDAPFPAGKRSCSSSPRKTGSNAVPNRVHRRVIVCDYGKAIYKASSRAALLETGRWLHWRTLVFVHESWYAPTGYFNHNLVIIIISSYACLRNVMRSYSI